MTRKQLGPERQQWKGIDANERALGTVHNALVGIILDGVAGVSPGVPGEERRLISPEDADRYIERGQQVLADFESQEMAPGGARGRAQKWMDRTILDLRRLVSDAEAVRSGKKPQKQTPESYAELRKHLGVGEARRYPQPKLPPRQFVAPREAPRGHRVADFNSLDDLIIHARDQDGATHVLVAGGLKSKLYFPRPDGQYGEARIFRQGGYWHTEAPSERRVVHLLPPDAAPIGQAPAYRRVAPREAPRAPRGRRAPTKWTTDNTQINTWFERDRASVMLETLDGTTIIEWWDDDVHGAVEDGFLNPRDWHGSAVEYANQMGAQPQVAREGRRTVRDYLAIDTRDRPIAGPFKSYSDARQAAGTGGAVQFVPSRGKASEAGDDHRERSLDRLYGHTRGRDPYPFPSDRDRGISGLYGPKSGGAGAPTLSRGARRPPERAPGARRRATRRPQ